MGFAKFATKLSKLIQLYKVSSNAVKSRLSGKGLM